MKNYRQNSITLLKYGVIIKYSGLDNKLAWWKHCDPRKEVCSVLLCINSRGLSSSFAPVRPRLSRPSCVAAGRWEVGVGCVPGALVSVPQGDSGAGHLRSKQLCLSLCVGQACALSLYLQMVSEKGCFLTLTW